MHYTIMRPVSLTLPVRMLIFDPALLDLEVAIAKNLVIFTETIKRPRVPSPLPNLKQYSTVWCPLGFKNASTTGIRC